jgi:hypothetical protein
MTIQDLSALVSARSSLVTGPWRKRRSCGPPLPTKKGWTHSRSSSSRPCSSGAGDLNEAVLHDVLARLPIEPPDLGDRVAADDSGVVPLWLPQPRRDDVFGHAVDSVAVGVAGAALPHRREPLVGAPPHEHRVAGKQQLGLDGLAGAVVGVGRRPVLQVLDDTVERDEGRVDDASHCHPFQIRLSFRPRGCQESVLGTLAADLEVSRGVIVEAYQQLLAEGYLTSRTGGYTGLAVGPEPDPAPEAPDPAPPLRIDFRYAARTFPGSPGRRGCARFAGGSPRLRTSGSAT